MLFNIVVIFFVFSFIEIVLCREFGVKLYLCIDFSLFFVIGNKIWLIWIICKIVFLKVKMVVCFMLLIMKVGENVGLNFYK